MAAEQLRIDINNVIDKLPDSVLPKVLDLLTEVSECPDNNFELITFIRNAFKEDKALLEKLAH